jgi:UDP-glucose 4-epimerase
MHVFVTGGAGYIGSIAVERLMESGHQVTVLDNLRTGSAGAIEASADFIHGDLRNGDHLYASLKRCQPDAVMHFAGVTIVSESVSDPGLYYTVNTTGGLNLLRAIKEAGVQRFIFSSTAAVYGSPGRLPVVEEDPLLPVSPYGFSKLMMEQMLQSYSAAHGLKYASLRYFNVAGATFRHGEDHRPETHLIPSALLSILGKRPPVDLFGTDYSTPDGTAIRDYVHVVDLIDAHIAVLERLDTICGAFNLGTRMGKSVAEVVSVIERVTGQTLPKNYRDRRPGDPPVLVADSSRARILLGWEPLRSSLEEMIESAWDWIRRNPGGYGE